MYHFGYGSNLKIDFLKTLIPNAILKMKAYLPNFRVEFRVWSKERNGGISTIFEAPGELVQGALYKVAEEEMKALDQMDGIYLGTYKRETFLVLGEDRKWKKADLYRAIAPKGPFVPSKSYVEIMLEGAHEVALDPDYIEKIQAAYHESQ
ncbi:MAG: gamma-glutamylcyclotransferase family protein [Candidatus Hodarchaeota archaeon]